MKMYILIKGKAPTGLAMVAGAHASLAAYLCYKDTVEMQDWLKGTFHKVVCQVTDPEFEAAKGIPDNVILTESSWDNQEIAISFRPRVDWPKAFQFFKLYRGTSPQKRCRIAKRHQTRKTFAATGGDIFGREAATLTVR
jgi:hypothetical protein